MDRHPYSLLQKVNSDSSRYSLILRINEPPPFQRWTLIAADCINNMRSALDYLIYAIARYEAGSQSPSDEDKLAFPISDDRSRFDQAVSNGKLGKISDPISTVIESLQPYHRPHPDLPPLLSVLRTLNNTDKHRLLGLVYGAVQGGNLSLVGDSEIPPKVDAVAHHGEVEDGTEILAFTCDPPTPNMHFDRGAEVSVVIAIWHGKRLPSGPDWSGRSDVVAVLTLLSEEVREVIYSVCAKVP
jgi:hypothetical protein